MKIMNEYMCVFQEDTAASEAVKGSSCGSPGLLQPGKHLHTPPGLWESHRLPPQTPHYSTGPQWQVEGLPMSPSCPTWAPGGRISEVCYLMQDRGGTSVLESWKCPHCTREPWSSHPLCRETPGNLQRGEAKGFYFDSLKKKKKSRCVIWLLVL